MAAVTYLEAIRQGIWEEMERDSSVFVLGEDVGIYGGAFKLTEGMLERFGEDRVVDTPISESAIVGAAIGAALMGMRPIAEMQFADFISCAFDQITNFAELPIDQPAPVVFCASSPGGGQQPTDVGEAHAQAATKANQREAVDRVRVVAAFSAHSHRPWQDAGLLVVANGGGAKTGGCRNVANAQ